MRGWDLRFKVWVSGASVARGSAVLGVWGKMVHAYIDTFTGFRVL